MIKSVSCFILLPKSLGKSKEIVFGSVIITGWLLSVMCTLNVIMTRLNYCKAFW